MDLACGLDGFQSCIKYIESISTLRPPIGTIYEELGRHDHITTLAHSPSVRDLAGY